MREPPRPHAEPGQGLAVGWPFLAGLASWRAVPGPPLKQLPLPPLPLLRMSRGRTQASGTATRGYRLPLHPHLLLLQQHRHPPQSLAWQRRSPQTQTWLVRGDGSWLR